VLALLAVAPVRAQDSVPLPTVPRAGTTPPAFPTAGGSLPPAFMAGNGALPPAYTASNAPPAFTTSKTQTTQTPGVETLPQLAPPPPGAAVGPAPEHATLVEASGDDDGYFRGVYGFGEYLLLLPRRNALDFALVSPVTTQTPGGTVESADWKTESGFRVGGGMRLPWQDWSFGIVYTNFASHQNSSEVAPPGGTLYATLTRGGSYDQVGSAGAFSDLAFNVLDFDLSHRFKLCPNFELTVFGGGRVAWIDQQLTADYNGGPDKATNDIVNSPVSFNGVGLTIGSEGLWNVWHGVGVYARVQGSLLSGQFRNSLSETANNGSVVIVNVTEKYDQVVPVLEMAFGLNYCGDHWHVSVGYELQNWFNMVDSITFPDSSNIGLVGRRTSDLSLEGLAIQLGFAF
jgi:hypothetical protein